MARGSLLLLLQLPALALGLQGGKMVSPAHDRWVPITHFLSPSSLPPRSLSLSLSRLSMSSSASWAEAAESLSALISRARALRAETAQLGGMKPSVELEGALERLDQMQKRYSARLDAALLGVADGTTPGDIDQLRLALQNELDTTESALELVMRRVEAADDAAAEARAERRRTEDTLAQTEAMLALTRDELAQAESRLAEAQTKLDATESALTAAKGDLKQTKEAAAEAIGEMGDNLEATQSTLAKTKASLTSTAKERDQLTAEVAKLRAERDAALEKAKRALAEPLQDAAAAPKAPAAAQREKEQGGRGPTFSESLQAGYASTVGKETASTPMSRAEVIAERDRRAQEILKRWPVQQETSARQEQESPALPKEEAPSPAREWKLPPPPARRRKRDWVLMPLRKAGAAIRGLTNFS